MYKKLSPGLKAKVTLEAFRKREDSISDSLGIWRASQYEWQRQVFR